MRNVEEQNVMKIFFFLPGDDLRRALAVLHGFLVLLVRRLPLGDPRAVNLAVRFAGNTTCFTVIRPLYISSQKHMYSGAQKL